jgi:hypothetical protein
LLITAQIKYVTIFMFHLFFSTTSTPLRQVHSPFLQNP